MASSAKWRAPGYSRLEQYLGPTFQRQSDFRSKNVDIFMQNSDNKRTSKYLYTSPSELRLSQHLGRVPITLQSENVQPGNNESNRERSAIPGAMRLAMHLGPSTRSSQQNAFQSTTITSNTNSTVSLDYLDTNSLRNHLHRSITVSHRTTEVPNCLRERQGLVGSNHRDVPLCSATIGNVSSIPEINSPSAPPMDSKVSGHFSQNSGVVPLRSATIASSHLPDNSPSAPLMDLTVGGPEITSPSAPSVYSQTSYQVSLHPPAYTSLFHSLEVSPENHCTSITGREQSASPVVPFQDTVGANVSSNTGDDERHTQERNTTTVQENMTPIETLGSIEGHHEIVKEMSSQRSCSTSAGQVRLSQHLGTAARVESFWETLERARHTGETIIYFESNPANCSEQETKDQNTLAGSMDNSLANQNSDTPCQSEESDTSEITAPPAYDELKDTWKSVTLTDIEMCMEEEETLSSRVHALFYLIHVK